MAIDRGKATILAGLVAVLAVVVYQATGGSQPSPTGPVTARGTAPSSNDVKAAAKNSESGGQGAPDVHLDTLNGDRPKPLGTDRNLFRFKPKAPPPAPRMTAPTVTAPLAPPVPTGPPPPPPITLKFIGIVERAGKPRIAMLSDGQGTPWYGSEGDAIAGRYRIIRIGVESIELSYLDGRGRQTIRLTGS